MALVLTLEDIKRRPAVTLSVTMECAGNGRALLNPRPISQPWMLEAISTAEWTGTPLRGLLEESGLLDDTVELLFTGLDRGIQADKDQCYQRSLTVDEVLREEVLLAHEMNGAPLEPQHGFPLRLVVPGWYGMTSVKWLSHIEALTEPFEGPQMQFYRYAQDENDPGDRVKLMKVRSLMIPPGLATFPTRERLVDAGPVVLTGRAWAGRSAVLRVEVSVDGGQNWQNAELDEPIGPHAWRGWSFEWTAVPGTHTLCVRATDSKGSVQPMEQCWSYYGVGNNNVSRVEISVK
jgi:DMSO/TMAO reductase YedYZ molybdopterin-dependent catalytic subunit